jgi:amidase
MGIMSDIGMPVGLTFAGRGYDDTNLLSYTWAFDHHRNHRIAAPRTPELPATQWVSRSGEQGSGVPSLHVAVSAGNAVNGMVPIRVELTTDAAEVSVSVNGVHIEGAVTETGFVAEVEVPESEHTRLHSEWRGGYGSVVIALAKNGDHVVGSVEGILGVL